MLHLFHGAQSAVTRQYPPNLHIDILRRIGSRHAADRQCNETGYISRIEIGEYRRRLLYDTGGS